MGRLLAAASIAVLVGDGLGSGGSDVEPTPPAPSFTTEPVPPGGGISPTSTTQGEPVAEPVPPAVDRMGIGVRLMEGVGATRHASRRGFDLELVVGVASTSSRPKPIWEEM